MSVWTERRHLSLGSVIIGQASSTDEVCWPLFYLFIFFSSLSFLVWWYFSLLWWLALLSDTHTIAAAASAPHSFDSLSLPILFLRDRFPIMLRAGLVLGERERAAAAVEMASLTNRNQLETLSAVDNTTGVNAGPLLGGLAERVGRTLKVQPASPSTLPTGPEAFVSPQQPTWFLFCHLLGPPLAAPLALSLPNTQNAIHFQLLDSIKQWPFKSSPSKLLAFLLDNNKTSITSWPNSYRRNAHSFSHCESSGPDEIHFAIYCLLIIIFKLFFLLKIYFLRFFFWFRITRDDTWRPPSCECYSAKLFKSKLDQRTQEISNDERIKKRRNEEKYTKESEKQVF